jgi:GNAT acetyltransferase-like protein
VRLRELRNERAYEAELQECAGVTGFHRWFFLTALAAALGLRMRAFAVDSGAESLGVVPLLLRPRGPLSTVNHLPAARIGPVLRGPALRAGRADELVRAVEPLLLAECAVVTRWAFSPGRELGADRLAARGFGVRYEENFVVSGAKSVEDYLKGLPPKQRAAIRRAAARGLTVGPSSAEEITRWFPWQVSRANGRQGTAAEYSHAAALKLAGRLGCDPRMYWRSVRGADGRTLAMNVSIIDADRLWGWLLVGDPVPGPSPHVAAYADAIQWSLGKGLACDFGGVPTQGIRDFKVAMGGEVELYAVAERVRPRAYRAVRALHERLVNYRASRAH